MRSTSTNQKSKQAMNSFKLEKNDIQGLIVRGYKSLNAARYIFLNISAEHKNDAKAYFRRLTEEVITNGNTSEMDVLTDNRDPVEAVQVAFTFTGLAKLGMQPQVLSTFSREFIEGMAFSYPNPWKPGEYIEERSALLGDTRNNHPRHWLWGNNENPVDCVLMFFAVDNALLEELIKRVFNPPHNAITKIKTSNEVGHTFTYKDKIDKEHFGFKDGIAQPLIKGLSKTTDGIKEGNQVNPGEIILGYKNEYNSFSPSPYTDADEHSKKLACLPGYSDKKDLGKNGTYMVFRQIDQHVEKFWHHLYYNSKEFAAGKIGKAIKLGAKMVGRWPEGEPLVACPNGGCPMDEKGLDNFLYASQDEHGVNCPLGAHIRRTNPRDQVHTGRNIADSLEMSAKHRMLRRGRIYGESEFNFDVEQMILHSAALGDKDAKVPDTPKGKTGLHFICMVSDISRQFEFVQSVWANTSTFGNLCNEVDPLISPRPTDGQPDCHEFTTPQVIVRNRYKNIPEFTTVVGGAYFFMPGINALRYIMQP